MNSNDTAFDRRSRTSASTPTQLMMAMDQHDAGQVKQKVYFSIGIQPINLYSNLLRTPCCVNTATITALARAEVADTALSAPLSSLSAEAI